MTPINLYLESSVLERDQLAVSEVSDSVFPVGRVPVGIGGDVGLWTSKDGNGVVLSAVVLHTTQIYDTALEWDPALWGVEVDIAGEVMAVREGAFELTFAAGPGLRMAALAQPWWDDYAYLGVGAHLSIDGTLGTGRVRGFLGLRASGQAVLGSGTGTLDSALQDLVWTWTPSAVRLGVHVGVALR